MALGRQALGRALVDAEAQLWAELAIKKDLKQELEEAYADLAKAMAALRRIADMCPATQEMTLAHQMAQEAEEALAK